MLVVVAVEASMVQVELVGWVAEETVRRQLPPLGMVGMVLLILVVAAVAAQTQRTQP